MLLFVVCQMALGGERPAATFVFATEGLFTGMDTHVSLQVTIFGE
jgi:hypothetical protein